MTQRVKVKITGVELGTQTSKAEEIELLQAIADQFEGKQMYLSSLFSRELVEWCSGRIRDDFPIDVMGEIEEFRKTNQELSRLQREDSTEAAKAVAKMEQEVRMMLEHKEAVEEEYRRLSKRYASLEDELEVARRDISSFLGKQAEEKARREELEKRIIELKAQLFDCMMKEKEGK